MRATHFCYLQKHAAVLRQPIKDIDRLPDAARDEVRKRHDVSIGDLTVNNPSITIVMDVILRKQVLLTPIDPQLLMSLSHLRVV